MGYEHEIKSLAAETLALQAILIGIMDRLAKSGPEMRSIVASGLDDAANYVEHIALKYTSAAPEHTAKALQIVEGLRATALGKPDKPTHVV
jgi:hypothetical protein